jgi:nitroreductase
MPDLFDAVRDRRSTRKYQLKPVPQHIVEEILEVAGLAPSAHNAQPWRFIILHNDLVKRELAEAMAEVWATDMAKEGLIIDAEMRNVRVERFASAPVLILACSTMDWCGHSKLAVSGARKGFGGMLVLRTLLL